MTLNGQLPPAWEGCTKLARLYPAVALGTFPLGWMNTSDCSSLERCWEGCWTGKMELEASISLVILPRGEGHLGFLLTGVYLHCSREKCHSLMALGVLIALGARTLLPLFAHPSLCSHR